MTSKFIIYGLVDPRDGQLRYVGKSVRGLGRPKEHTSRKNERTHKANWIQQLQALGLKYEIVIIQELDGPEILSQAEVFWIAYFRQLGCNLTNATDGGEGTLGREVSAATKELHRQHALGKVATQETRDRMASMKKGRPLALSHRERISLGRQGCKNKSPMTVEGKVSRSRTLGGRPIVDQNGTLYLGVRDAARRIGIDKRAIQMTLRGLQRKTRGFVLRYAE